MKNSHCSLIAFTLFPFTALASSEVGSSTTNLDLATTIGSLIFVLLLIFGLAWMMKKMRVPGMMGSSGPLKVIKQMPIGPKERIMIIQVGEEQLVVGVTAHNINLLTKLETPLEDASVESASFANQISQLMSKNE
ncbi:flagellar biosynthetic protein FliO [Aliivibrio kagoshimensis]|uniref:flagellar biosynthetic protein FliO n=1 Tax=Aliivibrio kagoshimensis TaxID=2910230 RepID=UPI003D11CE68